MSRAARAALLAAAAALVAVAGCTDVGTNPTSVVSISPDTVATTSLIAGDTLRDTNGVALRLQDLGRAFNGSGQRLATPGVQILLTPIDSTTTPTTAPATIAYGADSGAYLVALPGPVGSTTAIGVNLQYTRALRVRQRFEIVPRPDRVVRDTATSSTLAFTDSTTATGTLAFSVRVTYDSAGTRRPVRATLVRFAITTPFSSPLSPRIDSARFVETSRDTSPAGRLVRLDTTDAAGVASRTLTIYRSATGLRGTARGRDTIAVLATVVAGSQPFLGVPLVGTVVDSARTAAATVRVPAVRAPIIRARP